MLISSSMRPRITPTKPAAEGSNNAHQNCGKRLQRQEQCGHARSHGTEKSNDQKFGAKDGKSRLLHLEIHLVSLLDILHLLGDFPDKFPELPLDFFALPLPELLLPEFHRIA